MNNTNSNNNTVSPLNNRTTILQSSLSPSSQIINPKKYQPSLHSKSMLEFECCPHHSNGATITTAFHTKANNTNRSYSIPSSRMIGVNGGSWNRCSSTIRMKKTQKEIQENVHNVSLPLLLQQGAARNRMLKGKRSCSKPRSSKEKLNKRSKSKSKSYANIPPISYCDSSVYPSSQEFICYNQNCHPSTNTQQTEKWKNNHLNVDPQLINNPSHPSILQMQSLIKDSIQYKSKELSKMKLNFQSLKISMNDLQWICGETYSILKKIREEMVNNQKQEGALFTTTEIVVENLLTETEKLLKKLEVQMYQSKSIRRPLEIQPFKKDNIQKEGIVNPDLTSGASSSQKIHINSFKQMTLNLNQNLSHGGRNTAAKTNKTLEELIKLRQSESKFSQRKSSIKKQQKKIAESGGQMVDNDCVEWFLENKENIQNIGNLGLKNQQLSSFAKDSDRRDGNVQNSYGMFDCSQKRVPFIVDDNNAFNSINLPSFRKKSTSTITNTAEINTLSKTNEPQSRHDNFIAITHQELSYLRRINNQLQNQIVSMKGTHQKELNCLRSKIRELESTLDQNRCYPYEQLRNQKQHLSHENDLLQERICQLQQKLQERMIKQHQKYKYAQELVSMSALVQNNFQSRGHNSQREITKNHSDCHLEESLSRMLFAQAFTIEEMLMATE